MAFIHDHPRSSSALAVTITREIHISSERHERNNSMAELMLPENGAVHIVNINFSYLVRCQNINRE